MLKTEERYIKYDRTNLLTIDSNELAEYIFSTVKTRESKIFIHLNCNNLFDLRHMLTRLRYAGREITYLFEGIAMKSYCGVLTRKWLKDCNGTDTFPALAEKLNGEPYGVFFLGATEDVVAKAIEKINYDYPDLVVAGYYSGYFNDSRKNEIIQRINSSSADLLIVARGMLQEIEFLDEFAESINVKNIWCVGGLFDFISGNKPRAPRLIRKLRLEWLFRILIEPKRALKKMKVAIWLMTQIAKIKI